MKKCFECLSLGLLIFYLAVLVVLRLSSYDISVGNGESMTPTLNNGDLIITDSSKGDLEPGLIVVYEYDNEIFIHRVILVNDRFLKTKGDAFKEEDNRRVSISDVKGVYLFKIPYLGHLLIFAVKTPWGEIPLGNFLISILVGFFIICEISDKKSALRRAFRSLAKGGEK